MNNRMQMCRPSHANSKVRWLNRTERAADIRRPMCDAWKESDGRVTQSSSICDADTTHTVDSAVLAVNRRAMYGFVNGGVVRAGVGATLWRLSGTAESWCKHSRRVNAIVTEHLLLNLRFR